MFIAAQQNRTQFELVRIELTGQPMHWVSIEMTEEEYQAYLRIRTQWEQMQELIKRRWSTSPDNKNRKGEDNIT